MEVIYFYSPADDFGVLSNFARTPINLDDLIWPTSEHLFQTLKFTGDADNPQYRDHIRRATTPALAAKLGRNRDVSIRSDWEEIKVNAMLKVITLKAYQYPFIQTTLRRTNNALLVEKSYKDAYWGMGADGNGLNMLGKLWMQVRMEFK